MSEHRYDIKISESYVDPNPSMVERQDPDNFTRFQTRERCALEIAAYVFKLFAGSRCGTIREIPPQFENRIMARVTLHAHRPIPWNQPLPYIEGLLFMDFDNVTLTSQKSCQHNNKFDCSETNGCNIP